MKKLCIYHANCADGFTSAWIVNKFEKDVEFFAATYQNPPPDNINGREIIMVDFCYKLPVLQHMAEKAKSIIILDHHKSAKEDLLDGGLPDNVSAIFDMERSGARITWDYYTGCEPPPMLVSHVEDRDLWRFKIPGTKEFQNNLFSYEYTFENWDAIHAACQNTAGYNALLAGGEAITRKHNKDVKELISVAATRGVIAGHEVPLMNAPYFFSSEAGHIMAKGEAFAACYYDVPEGRCYSLRAAEDGEDVAAIAVKFGGGGHAKAAGFTLPFDKLHTLENPDG